MRKETLKEIDRRPLLPVSLFDQTFAKRKKLNPYVEQEYTEETTGNIVAEKTNSVHTIPSRGSPSTS